MSVFILISLIPITIGCYFWYNNKQVIWLEWVIGTLVALLFAVFFYSIINYSLITDYEIISGRVIKTIFYPKWIEEHTVTYEDSNGKTCTSTTYITHNEYWVLVCNNFGEKKVSKNNYQDITEKFGNKINKIYISKSGFYSGDRNIYVCMNETDYFQPTTGWKWYENKVQSSPSLFGYEKVEDNDLLYEYPKCNNFLMSDRLMGFGSIDIEEFDKICSNLSRKQNVNLIILYFNTKDSSIAHLQESKWIGGNRNDLVLCKGQSWSYVFGWTDQEIVKRNLETILLNNDLNNDILSLIEREVWKHYKMKDFEDFDYLQQEISFWVYVLYMIITFIIQFCLWVYFHHNELQKSRMKYAWEIYKCRM